MIRRSPAEAYIKYLVLHPKKHTNQDIKDICAFAQLDVLGDWYINRLRAQLDPPAPFHPFDRNHKASRNYILATGLGELFTPDDAGRKAFKILELPRVKEFIEAMIISNAPSVAIAYSCGTQFRFPCAPLVIDRYRAFFWNVDLIDSTELRALLAFRFSLTEDNQDKDIKKQHEFLKRAYWSDARKTAADLPFSPLSALIAQMRMGVMPSDMDLSKVLEMAQRTAALRTVEAVILNGKGDAMKALDFASVIEKTTNVLKEVVKPDEDVRKELSQIALRTSETETPTVHQLSAGGGSFTTDVGPKEVAHELPSGDDGEGTSYEDGTEPG